jgi:hypothetical protein
MIANTHMTRYQAVKQQGAEALMAAALDFLRRNNIHETAITNYARRQQRTHGSKENNLKLYRRFMRAYEDMGVLMATWYSQPRFLNKSGEPLPLTTKAGPRSIPSLLRVSGVRISKYFALEMMRYSPSVKLNGDGTVVALRRVFILPEFEVPRAAFAVERYLDTLRRNAIGRRGESTLLLERSCHVSGVDLKTITPILRDIEGRGTALMDSVDGEIEACRLRRSRRKGIGEMGVLIFAWARPSAMRGKISAKK